MTKTHWEGAQERGKRLGEAGMQRPTGEGGAGLTTVSGVELRKGCELLISHRGWCLARGHTSVWPLMHFYFWYGVVGNHTFSTEISVRANPKILQKSGYLPTSPPPPLHLLL